MSDNYDKFGRLLHAKGLRNKISDDWDLESRLRLADCVFNNSVEGICVTDSEERIIEINPTLCEISGFKKEQILGQTPRLFKSGLHEANFYRTMWQTIADFGQWTGELWNKRPDETRYAARLTISAIRNSRGKLTHYVGIMSDVTEGKRQQAHLEKIAHFDALTGIPNRLLLADRLRQAIAQAQRSGTFLAVCYLDLDGFKEINDHYGHEVGDCLLVEIAQRLNAILRAGDTVARLGGDEFVLLLWGLDNIADCNTMLQRIVENMATPVFINEHSLTISVSIGVAFYPKDAADPDILLGLADSAMYRAKFAGKNRYCLFDLRAR